MCGIAFALVADDDEAEHRVVARFEDNVRRRGPDAFCATRLVKGSGDGTHGRRLVFLSSLLQMQGVEARRAMLRDGDRVLLYNGEVYDGLPVGANDDRNDGEALFEALVSSGSSVASVMSGIRGPWAFVYYDGGDGDSDGGVLWWGRDVMGRKSLMVVGEEEEEEEEGRSVEESSRRSAPSFVLASVADGKGCTEVVPGLYRVCLAELVRDGLDAVVRVGWASEGLVALAEYERSSDNGDRDHDRDRDRDSEELLELLSDAVVRRCATASYVPGLLAATAGREARFMVLFSGGVDSTLIAALVHKALPAHEPIELCSICFASGVSGEASSPDRIGALDAYVELKTQFPDRPWRFIAVDASYEDLKARENRLLALLHPRDSVMDFNIGGALWLAAAGTGRLIDVVDDDVVDDDASTNDASNRSLSGAPHAPTSVVVDERYVSKARVVFLGHGADELFGGYGRHRTRFTKGGWPGLKEELRLDVRRIWERNFGRDDRVVSDLGKEARLPFMDERVLEFALRAPLESLMDFSLPAGQGDKRIVRDCLGSLGLERASRRVKRAMQFGTRLAKASNEALFGTNTQANRIAGGRAKWPSGVSE